MASVIPLNGIINEAPRKCIMCEKISFPLEPCKLGLVSSIESTSDFIFDLEVGN